MKPKKYEIYFQIRKYVRSKKKAKGWKEAKKKIEWFKRRGIRAYAKKTKKSKYIKGI